MVLVFTVRGLEELKKVEKSVKSLNDKVPRATSTAMHQYGNKLVRNLKDSARLADIKSFAGDNGLYGKGIRWEQAPNGKIGTLYMAQHGIFLDSMHPHHLTVRKGRGTLLRWMKQARSSNLRKIAKSIESGKRERYGLYVKPHPFIQRGLRMSNKHLSRLLGTQVNKAVKSAFNK